MNEGTPLGSEYNKPLAVVLKGPIAELYLYLYHTRTHARTHNRARIIAVLIVLTYILLENEQDEKIQSAYT
jgi:hypothetical protein